MPKKQTDIGAGGSIPIRPALLGRRRFAAEEGSMKHRPRRAPKIHKVDISTTQVRCKDGHNAIEREIIGPAPH